MFPPAPGTPGPAATGTTVWLIPAGAVCGFGLGALALALAPGGANGSVGTVAPLPPVQQVAGPSAATDAATALPAPRAWPALFGQPPAAAAPEPVAAAAEDPPPEPVPPLDARLRGLALDENGGWALIETGGLVALVRPGSALDAHHSVAEILADGVLITGPDAVVMLGFDDSAPADGGGTVRASLARSYLRGAQDLFDMPMPLPPAGYIPGPGFGGMTNQ